MPGFLLRKKSPLLEKITEISFLLSCRFCFVLNLGIKNVVCTVLDSYRKHPDLLAKLHALLETHSTRPAKF